DIHDIPGFFMHILERIDLTRDLHFLTNTTIDTLDYTGDGLNAGSKVTFAAVGKKKRELWREIPSNLNLARPFNQAKMPFPGVIVLDGQPLRSSADEGVPIDACGKKWGRENW